MRTRNVDPAKSAAPKKTPPGRRSAAKTTPDPAAVSATPKTAETKRGSAAKAKQANNNETTTSPFTGSDSKPEQTPPSLIGSTDSKPEQTTPLSVTGSDSKPEQSAVDEAKPSTNAALTSLEAKATPRKRTVVKKRVVRVVKKTPAKAKTPVTTEGPSSGTPSTQEAVKVKVEEKSETVDAKYSDTPNNDGFAGDNDGESAEKNQATMEIRETVVQNVMESAKEGKVIELEEPFVSSKEDMSAGENVGDSTSKEQTAMEVDVNPNEVAQSSMNEEPSAAEKGDEMREQLKEIETKNVDDKEEPRVDAVVVEENIKDGLKGEASQPEHGEYGGDEGYEEYGDRVDFEDNGEDDYVEEDPEEPADEAETLEEERRQLTAIAKERKIKKESEIFVGGLDRDATEEDVRKVFENVGEVIEVRLHKHLSMGKNRGYAFVKFANKELAKRALAEMKNPVIHGKRCGTAPSEDNDTLFLGNICNTWTKEAIRQKLKDYGVEGVENITLVSDVQHEGKSRGFAFLEFSCHADAMLAYKRLQKPDVVFGHLERTAKVAFAEPIREPDPEIMAQVKTVFLDGLPPHWDEDRVREHLKGYGEIVRVVLARNMSTAKRKDFGFVDFSTHDAAVACIERLNNTELGDGNTKMRVRARLSNPLPKTQAVKGGMRGGFRIGHAGSGSFSRFGRGFGRGGQHFNWANVQRRGFYQRGHGQSSRMGPNDYGFNNQYAMFHGRQNIGRGGRRGPLRGGYYPAGRGVAAAVPLRSNLNRPWHDDPERGHVDPVSSRRQPFSPEEGFHRPFVGRHFDDPYFYDDGAHGMKRPFYMTDADLDYTEPSRVRPRLDYADPPGSFRETSYRDTYGAGNDPYPHEYYGSDYGPYPSYYGSDRSYRGGYYY